MTQRALMTILALALAGAVACDQQTSDGGESAEAEAPSGDDELETVTSSSSNNSDRYSVVSPKSSVDVGKTSTVEFQVKPASGLKINHEYPWKVTFEGAEAVEVASKTVGRSQIELEDDAATIPVQLRANAEGTHTLAAKGSFSVCNDTKCWVMRDESVEFELAAASESNEEKPSKEGK